MSVLSRGIIVLLSININFTGMTNIFVSGFCVICMWFKVDHFFVARKAASRDALIKWYHATEGDKTKEKYFALPVIEFNKTK